MMKVDYVRVYGAADTSTRHEYSFVDSRTGWVEMNVPYTSLSLSENQPDGATSGEFNSANVWGYGFRITDSESSDRAAGVFYLDQVNLITGAPTSVNTAEVDGAVTHSLQLVAAVAGVLIAVAVLVTRRARRLITIQANNE